MRSRLLAALLTVTALATAGAASAHAAGPDSSPTSSTSAISATADTSPDTTASTSTTLGTSTSTTTTVPGDDAVVAPAAGAIDGPASGAGGATRSATTVLAGEEPPPPDWALPPENSGTGRRVVYSNSAMRVWAVDDDGTVVKTHRVSGKAGMPSPGEYSVWSRSLYTYSAENPNIRWQYMVRFAWTPRGGNIGFHEIPRNCGIAGCPLMQTDDQLGQSLSGGCVRQSRDDAIWMWDWAQIGTKVVVLA